MNKVLDHLKAALAELENIKAGEERGAKARFLSIAITDLEKVIAFVAYYLR